MENIEKIIFDFDGVLIDSFEFHRKKVEDFANIKLDKQVYKNMHNGNFYDSIPEEIKHINWVEYAEYIYEEIILFEINKDIKKVLLELSKKYKLHIVSSGWTKAILKYLKNNKIDFIFCEILGGEIYNSKVEKFKMIFEKYNTNSEKCVFVTDTLGDILEAKEVGIKTFAVDFGYHDRKILEKGKPYKIISSFEELKKDLIL